MKAAAESFRPNPALNTTQAISELGVGEALVSTLGDNGVPAPVQRVLIRPPQSRMGPATDVERSAIRKQNPNEARYSQAYDPRSAHEVLLERIAAQKRQQEEAEKAEAQAKARTSSKTRSSRETPTEAFVKSMVRSLGTAAGSGLGRKLFRGLLGSLLK